MHRFSLSEAIEYSTPGKKTNLALLKQGMEGGSAFSRRRERNRLALCWEA